MIIGLFLISAQKHLSLTLFSRWCSSKQLIGHIQRQEVLRINPGLLADQLGWSQI